MDGTLLNTTIRLSYTILSITMSELRARNVKPSQAGVTDVKTTVGDKASDGILRSGIGADE